MRRGGLERSLAVAAALVALCALDACKSPPGQGDPNEPKASPQANVVPAPLTTKPAAALSASTATVDAGPPPDTLRPLSPFPVDTVARDGAGYALNVAVRFLDVPVVARGDIPAAAIEAARRRVEPSFVVTMSPTRARMVLRGKASLLPEGSEIRMRSDVYGAVYVDADGATYRPLAPGTLRALFNERRLDVAPLTPAETSAAGDGAKRLGYATRKIEVWTRAAKATFELARVPDAGEGGVLLCRFLLDWMSAPPSTPLCDVGDVPLHAELRWTPRGVLVFDATSILRRLDLLGASLTTPPASARFTNEPLPKTPGALFFGPQELASLKPGSEPSRLTLQNDADEPRIAWVDGIPVGWVAPDGRLDVQGVPKVKVGVDWRTFFDDAERAPAQTVVLPGASEASGGDAGRP